MNLAAPSLQLDAQPKRAGIVIELAVADHGSEIHEGLPAIGQHGDQSCPKIGVISRGRLVLESKACGVRSQVFSEFDSNMPLVVGEFVNVVGVDLMNEHAKSRTVHRRRLNAGGTLQ